MLIFNTHERAEPVSSEVPTFSSPVGELGEGAVTSQAGFSHPKQPPTMCYFHESNVDILPKFCYFPYLPNYKQECKFSAFNLISDFFNSIPLKTIFEISTFEYI